MSGSKKIVGASRGAIVAAGGCLAIGAALAPAGASAGPSSNEIAELSRILSGSPALSGTPTTSALSGGMSGNTPSPAGSGGGPATSSPDRTAGTTADSRQGGPAGTREMNATIGNQIATSPEDVRRQQEGRPTTAAAAEMGQRPQSDQQRVEVVPGAPGTAPGTDERMARAKSDLETARSLNQRDDGSCRDAITRVRQALVLQPGLGVMAVL